MLLTQIRYFDQPVAVGCDAKCSKAWGINNRPKVQLSDDEDDYYWLADGELGEAPTDPGTYEGGHAKPTAYSDGQDHRLNKWCVRECERCTWAKPNELVEIKSFDERIYNQPQKHPDQPKD